MEDKKMQQPDGFQEESNDTSQMVQRSEPESTRDESKIHS